MHYVNLILVKSRTVLILKLNTFALSYIDIFSLLKLLASNRAMHMAVTNSTAATNLNFRPFMFLIAHFGLILCFFLIVCL